jgi:hypothetical protein
MQALTCCCCGCCVLLLCVCCCNRQGMVGTTVKTSCCGYLQRCCPQSFLCRLQEGSGRINRWLPAARPLPQFRFCITKSYFFCREGLVDTVKTSCSGYLQCCCPQCLAVLLSLPSAGRRSGSGSGFLQHPCCLSSPPASLIRLYRCFTAGRVLWTPRSRPAAAATWSPAIVQQ